MKKFLTVLLVIAVMFTFSFSSAFAATDTDKYEGSQSYSEMRNAEAYQVVDGAGTRGITEAYRDKLVDEFETLLDSSETGPYVVKSANYYTAEKAAAKEAITKAIADVKAAATAEAATKVQTDLYKGLDDLVKGTYTSPAGTLGNKGILAEYEVVTANASDWDDKLDTVTVGIGKTLNTVETYFLAGYGYIDADLINGNGRAIGTMADTAGSASDPCGTSLEGTAGQRELVIKWFVDNGYRTASVAKAHVADFLAALVPVNDTWELGVINEWNALNNRAKALAAKAPTDVTSLGTLTAADVATIDTLLSNEKDFGDKYCTSDQYAKDTFTFDDGFTAITGAQNYVLSLYLQQYNSELRTVDLKDKAAVIALYDKVDALFDEYDYALKGKSFDDVVDFAPVKKAYDAFKKADKTAVEKLFATNAFTVTIPGKAGVGVDFDSAEANVKALEAARTAYDEYVKNYGYEYGNDWVKGEARILAAEWNKKAAAEYGEEETKIDTSKVQAYLNNATVKVTTAALGNTKIRVQAKIDTVSFEKILDAMDEGCTVSYKFYHKTAKATAFKGPKEKDRNYITYTKKSLKKGVKYKFQCGVVIKDAQGNVVAEKSYKASTTGSRVCR